MCVQKMLHYRVVEHYNSNMFCLSKHLIFVYSMCTYVSQNLSPKSGNDSLTSLHVFYACKLCVITCKLVKKCLLGSEKYSLYPLYIYQCTHKWHRSIDYGQVGGGWGVRKWGDAPRNPVNLFTFKCHNSNLSSLWQ